MPCLPNNIDINRYNGAACWNAGWGTDEVDGQVEFQDFLFFIFKTVCRIVYDA